MVFAIPRFSPTPYKPSGHVSPAAVLALLLAAGVIGGVIGIGAGMVKTIFYFVLIFPMLFGAVLGGLLGVVARKTKTRSPLVAGLAGAAGAIVIAAAMHGFGYYQYVSDGPAPPLSFAEFMDALAQRGVTITHRGSSGLNLGYVGSYIYWGVEVVVMAVIAIAMAAGAAAEPFCEKCESWMKARLLGGLVGGAAEGETAARAILDGELEALRALQPAPLVMPLRVQLSTCRSCVATSDAHVKLLHVVESARNKKKTSTKTLAHATYPGHAIPAIEGLFAEQA